MRYLDFGRIEACAVAYEPFEHMLVAEALSQDALPALQRDYPAIEKPGSFAIDDVRPGPALRELVAELESPAFRSLVERKFGLDLAGKPTTCTLRGVCAARDGRIHTDSRSKIVTVLLYLNPGWAADGGRLRLLRDGEDLENFAAEIAPTFGRMLIFRRSDSSWHGHRPFEGRRRVLQMNWVTGGRASLVTQVRHRVSALAKAF